MQKNIVIYIYLTRKIVKNNYNKNLFYKKIWRKNNCEKIFINICAKKYFNLYLFYKKNSKKIIITKIYFTTKFDEKIIVKKY